MNWKNKRLRRSAMWMILLATLAVVNSCSTAKPILDSVIVRDTLVVTETKYLIDTLEVMKDTTIYRDKVRVQIQYVDRKVVVEAVCEPDTIRITQTKILTKQEPKTNKWTLESYIGMLAFILTFAYLIKRWVDKLME